MKFDAVLNLNAKFCVAVALASELVLVSTTPCFAQSNEDEGLTDADRTKIISLNSHKWRRDLAPFFGTFEGTDESGKRIFVTVDVVGENLSLYYSYGRSVGGRNFDLSAKPYEMQLTDSGIMNGIVKVRTEVLLSQSAVQFRILKTAPYGQEVETFYITRLSGNRVSVLGSRRYYKRQFGYFGEWVPDEASDNAENNTRLYAWSLSMIISEVLPHRDFSYFVANQSLLCNELF